MISYIEGKLEYIDTDSVIVENNGIGYNIFVPSSVIGMLPDIGETVKIHTYFYVKEDAMNLYGFISKDDLKLFKLLITVNGIGPKGAMSLLSAMTVDELKYLIITDNAKSISKAPGVGLKTAQRIIIDLKDKIESEALIALDINKSDGAESDATSNQAVNEAIEALVSLGYSQSEAKNAVKGVSDNQDTVEDILKKALKNLI